MSYNGEGPQTFPVAHLTTPNLAVITPFRNAAPFLKDCLQSVAEDPAVSTHILVDDASTDDSQQVIKEFVANCQQPLHHTLLNVATQHHQYVAMNAGIDFALQCGAEYIAFLDADDVAMPQRFTRQHIELTKRVNCLAVGGLLSDIDHRGASIPQGRVQTTPGNFNLDQWRLELPQGVCPFWPCTATFHRDVFVNLGGFMPVPTLGDLEFVNRLAWWCILKNQVVHNLDTPANFRRVHPGQVSQQQDGGRIHFRASYLAYIRNNHQFYRSLMSKKLLVAEQLYYGRWPAPVTSSNTLPWPKNQPSTAVSSS